MLNPFVFLQVFNANTDGGTVKEILFGVTVPARVVRIWLLSKNRGFYYFRFEILGCVYPTTAAANEAITAAPNEATTAAPNDETAATGRALVKCNYSLSRIIRAAYNEDSQNIDYAARIFS